MEHLTNPVKKIREALNLSQVCFAQKLGKNQSTISHYETGERRPDIPTAQTMLKLANTNGIIKTLDAFYDDIENFKYRNKANIHGVD